MVKIIRAILVQRGMEDEGCFVCVDLLKNRTIIANLVIDKYWAEWYNLYKHYPGGVLV